MAQQLLSKEEIQSIYNNLADTYDRSLSLFSLIGFRYRAYRQEAVDRLDLSTGDTVVDLGCGTGLNFRFLEDNIGAEGTLIGVDLSDEMLRQARERAERNGWDNVELIQSDMADFNLPDQTDAVLSTGAITMLHQYDQVIRKLSSQLQAGKHMSILEFKYPERWPRWLARITISLLKPYGVRSEHIERTPWRSMEQYFSNFSMKEFYFGAVYVADGIA